MWLRGLIRPQPDTALAYIDYFHYPDRYQDERGQKMTWDTVWAVVAELDRSRT